MNKHIASFIFFAAMAIGSSGCSSESVNTENNSSRSNKDAVISSNSNNNANKEEKIAGSHVHAAPHGGTLIVFGDEAAHLELVLDETSGKLTAYVLDGEAEKGVPIAQEFVEVEIEKPKTASLKLMPVENALTGEKAGSTSQFSVLSDELKGLSNFDANIKSLNVKGREFRSVHFNFPKGNEEKHKH